ncbi:MAG TPA: FkbM family methyltransferase [Longimicrobiales bacterium]|nr:FkbM family methyltransferase [Longimicrobiales bacterium]
MRRSLGLLRSLVVYWRPGRQRGLRRLYRPFVGPGDLVFDVGAHLGDRTAAFASLGARVVALEPQPAVARWLRRLVGRMERVTVREVAVGARVGTARLAVSRATPTLSTLADGWRRRVTEANPGFRGARWEDEVEVAVTTLDALVDEFGPPAFCKIDVEGFEARVLEGLGRPVRALSVEFVDGALDVARRCVLRLRELGSYEFNVVPGEGRTFVFSQWRDPDAVLEWLRDGAGGAASGDLYARLRPPHPHSDAPEQP